MLFLRNIPRLIRWVFSVVLIFFVTMSLYRLAFYFTYNPSHKAFSGSAFLMGLRFDAKFASILGLIILALCSFPFLHPFKNIKAAKFWNIVVPFVFVLMLIFFGADFYHFDYLHQRLNASVLNYLQDAGISFGMMWQTYPIVKFSIGLLIFAIVGWILFSRLLLHYQTQYTWYKRKGVVQHIVFFLFLAILIFGKFSQYPLRWSDAFTLSDDFKANLALNPFQSFFSSLKFKNSKIDINKVKQTYPIMAAHLGVTHFDSINLNFDRKLITQDTTQQKPNIVLVICESFSAYKSSMYGNELNATPYFNELCKNGLFFDKCFTPSYGTARGVWATITGIPDVEHPKTASRNPLAVDQHTIINDFKGYEKFYFLGGDPTWANIQGLLSNNIEGLKIYQQDNFKAKKIDVWGISDKNLFLEANAIFKTQTTPFFSVIQTADNHRPYTIPSEDKAEFKLANYTLDALQKNGFESNDELNAFRYTDFCYQKFIEAAKKETYFNNTIFVFIGDHGIRGNATMYPKVWTEQGITAEHVPLLFYSPKFIAPQKLSFICSQIDVLPTIAPFTKTSFTNNTLGRNILDTSYKNKASAFIFDDAAQNIGVLKDEYYFVYNMSSKKETIFSTTNNLLVQKNNNTDSVKSSLRLLTSAYYTTAKYLLLNNKKR
jgi:phosphoglycerol transferase MdoB-like AlkP superfamily enzyme